MLLYRRRSRGWVIAAAAAALWFGQVAAEESPLQPLRQEAALPGSAAPSNRDIATPLYGGQVDPLSRMRGSFGLFANIRLPKKETTRQKPGAKLLPLPQPQIRDHAIDRNGGTARLDNGRSGTVLRGMVESWSHDPADSRERGQRTAVFGAERDLVLQDRRLTLESEVGLHSSDAAGTGGSRSLENLGYAFRLGGEDPSTRVSYGLALDYRGAGFRPDVEVGDELRGRLNGAWRLGDDTRLSGYLGRSARELGTDNPYDGWSAGLAMEQALPPELIPGLTAELGLEGSRVGNAKETEELVRTRTRLALRARLAPGLRGRMAVIADREQEQIQGLSRQGREFRLGVEQDFDLFGAAAQLGSEASLGERSGSDVAQQTGAAGLSFGLRNGEDSLTLRGRLLRREDQRMPQFSGLGGELTASALHLGSGYSAGLEATLQDRPADDQAAAYRAGVFLNLPF